MPRLPGFQRQLSDVEFFRMSKVPKKICEQIVGVPVPQVAEQFFACFVAVPVPRNVEEILEVCINSAKSQCWCVGIFGCERNCWGWFGSASATFF